MADTNLGPCPDNIECFNCSLSDNCQWTLGQCVTSTPREESIYWWNNFNDCNDIPSSTISNKYCGTSYLIINEDVLTIELPVVELGYARHYLYCVFHLTNPKEDSTISVKSTIMSRLDALVLDIYAVFSDSTKSYKNINAVQSSVAYKKLSSLDIHFLSYQTYSSLPFQITITKTSGKSNVGLYVAISLIIVACLICSVSVFFLSKRIAENARMRERSVIEANEIANTNNIQDMNNKDTNANKINYLFLNSLLPQLYIKELAKHGSTCTICLDDFKSTDKVCLTPCSHVFHYNCLSSRLHKNKINPKCPNCNTPLLNEDENQNVEVIQVRRAYNNSYQNSFDGTRIQLMQMNRSNLRPANENIVS